MQKAETERYVRFLIYRYSFQAADTSIRYTRLRVRALLYNDLVSSCLLATR